MECVRYTPVTAVQGEAVKQERDPELPHVPTIAKVFFSTVDHYRRAPLEARMTNLSRSWRIFITGIPLSLSASGFASRSYPSIRHSCLRTSAPGTVTSVIKRRTTSATRAFSRSHTDVHSRLQSPLSKLTDLPHAVSAMCRVPTAFLESVPLASLGIAASIAITLPPSARA